MEGAVKWMSQTKGYGFITGDDGQDYFLHVSQIENNEELKEKDKVQFEIKETPKGKQATRVAKL